MQKDDVVVVVVRGKPKLATYVEQRPNGTHIVRIGDDERLVDGVIELVKQPEKPEATPKA